jgi:hypothetical protein
MKSSHKERNPMAADIVVARCWVGRCSREGCDAETGLAPSNCGHPLCADHHGACHICTPHLRTVVYDSLSATKKRGEDRYYALDKLVEQIAKNDAASTRARADQQENATVKSKAAREHLAHAARTCVPRLVFFVRCCAATHSA